ncbi:transposase [Bacteroidia bacterium]|nr:transposase [Bacteroidia bacterium]
MTEYPINRGIGKPAEFKGLKSQYLFIFAGGLLGLFVVFAVLYMAGVNQWACIAFGVISALILVYGTFYLNTKYGEHGLLKAQARRNHPRYVISRRTFPRLFQVNYELRIKNYGI